MSLKRAAHRLSDIPEFVSVAGPLRAVGITTVDDFVGAFRSDRAALARCIGRTAARTNHLYEVALPLATRDLVLEVGRRRVNALGAADPRRPVGN